MTKSRATYFIPRARTENYVRQRAGRHILFRGPVRKTTSDKEQGRHILFRGPVRKTTSDKEQGDIFYSAGPYGKLRQTKSRATYFIPRARTEKLRQTKSRATYFIPRARTENYVRQRAGRHILFRGPVRKTTSDKEQGDIFYSAGPYGKLRQTKSRATYFIPRARTENYVRQRAGRHILFRGPVRKTTLDKEQGDIFYSAGPYGKLR